jgi:hypothetical protein
MLRLTKHEGTVVFRAYQQEEKHIEYSSSLTPLQISKPHAAIMTTITTTWMHLDGGYSEFRNWISSHALNFVVGDVGACTHFMLCWFPP